jgi:chromosome segregation ATPase
MALGTASITATFAQTSDTTTPPATTPACPAGGWHHHRHGSILTADEVAQLKKAHDAAIAANGTLQTEQASLKSQFQALRAEGKSATPAEWQALHQQKEDFKAKLRSAELAIDPTLSPIFAKLDAARSHQHHHTDSAASTAPAT